ncbi:uncharacterized protein VTP21DRAFT_1843 [Calcarisporiella thermophila]|uniref:uncharacterized protein n=1 Tax=Calcarisporiella thermophila TaxID=911321 RepID=UPI00374246DF
MNIDFELADHYGQPLSYANVLVLAYKSIGIIYGDITTSPLYVFSAVFSTVPEKEDVYGSFSLIFWSLTLILVVKYSLIVLQCDDNGEGGIFSLFSLLCRHCDIPVKGKLDLHDLTLTNYDTGDFSRRNPLRQLLSKSRRLQTLLRGTVLFGAALMVGDGLLTPAVSVLAAVEGLEIKVPSLQPLVVPLTCTVITCLFLSQRMGTDRISSIFAPIVTCWLLLLFFVGLYNITHHPEIMRAINPLYLIRLFVNNGSSAWQRLGGVLLAVTGVEALFADMGHFSRSAIQLSSMAVVYPTLIVVYAGQAARLVDDPSLVENTFWLTVPHAVYWPMFAFATMATIIASQAMISACFSLVRAAIALDCFPRLRIKHTSLIRGQVYIPMVSYLLLTLSLLVVITFKESSRLTNAYGLAVAGEMVLTTTFVSLVMNIIWDLSYWVIGSFAVTFLFIDGLLLSSACLKFINGGWLPLTLAIILTIIMGIWRWGSSLKTQNEEKFQCRFNHMFMEQSYSNYSSDPSKADEDTMDTNENHRVKLGDAGKDDRCKPHDKKMTDKHPTENLLLQNGVTAIRTPGMAIFCADAEDGIPFSFRHFVNHFFAIPEVVLMLHVHHVAIPYVHPRERLLVTRLPLQHFYRCTLRIGYLDRLQEDGLELARRCVEEIEKMLRSGPLFTTPLLSSSREESHKKTEKALSEGIEREVSTIHRAANLGVTFVLGRITLCARTGSSTLRRLMLERVFGAFDQGGASGQALEDLLGIPFENLVEVGLMLSV